MVHRIAFWSCFGKPGPPHVSVPPSSRGSSVKNDRQANNAACQRIGLAVRFWQVGIEMRPFFNKSSLWAYPAYALGGASFGYWLQGVDDRQTAMLTERKNILLEKRERKAQRDAQNAAAEA